MKEVFEMVTEKEFEAILKYLQTLNDEDPKSKKIFEDAGFTNYQLSLISIYIVDAIRAYDKLKSGVAFIRGDTEKII